VSTTTVNRASPPPPGAVHSFRFPAFTRRRLPSGVEVYVAQLPGAPLLSVEILAPGGSLHDPRGQAGLATMVGALLDEGAAGKDAMQIADGIERLGGQIATGADWDVGYAVFLMLSDQARPGLRLLTEVAAAPTFPEDEIERMRRMRLAEILRRRHQPAVVADEQFAVAVYRGTVYANPPGGTEESLAAMGREAIAGFYRRHYRLSDMVLVAVSDLDPEQLLAEASEALAAAVPSGGGGAGGGTEVIGDRGAREAMGAADSAGGHGAAAVRSVASPPIEPAPLPGPRVVIVDRADAAQTELRIGHAGVPRNHPDFTALSFLNTVLGGKFTSRINLNLRERHGLTYSASSRFFGRLGPGPFVVSAAVATESTGTAAREVLAELRRIQDEPVGDDEMDESRSYKLGVFPQTVQTIADLTRRLADLAVYGLADDYYDRYLESVAALGRNELQEVARRHLHPGHAAIVAVGPAAQLLPQLEPLGEVEVRAEE
jgi:zinc protease